MQDLTKMTEIKEIHHLNIVVEEVLNFVDQNNLEIVKIVDLQEGEKRAYRINIPSEDVQHTIIDLVADLKSKIKALPISNIKKPFIIDEGGAIRISYHNGYNSQTIKAMKKFMDIHLKWFGGYGEDSHGNLVQEIIEGENFVPATPLGISDIENPGAFFEVFKKTLSQTIYVELVDEGQDPIMDMVPFFAKNFRILQYEDLADKESYTREDVKKIVEVIIAGYRNPIQLFYYCYFLEKFLSSHGCTIDYEALYKDVFKILDNKLFGIFNNNIVDFSGSFISKAGLNKINVKKHDQKQDSTPRCPALSMKVFLRIKEIVFELISYVEKKEAAYFEELASKVEEKGPGHISPYSAFFVGKLFTETGKEITESDLKLDGNPYLIT